MNQITQVAFDERSAVRLPDRIETAARPPFALAAEISLSLHHDLAEIERDWRGFEERADGTAFQTFDWLSMWHRHIGVREGVQPAIVVGWHRGEILFMMPFALQTAGLRRVTWLGGHLSNCNAPLLARDFSKSVSPAQFLLLWREIEALLRNRLHHDLIDLNKIPATVGTQANPMLALQVTPHANDTYVMNLKGSWEDLYQSKRSSSWRKTDGKKRRRLAKYGGIKFSIAVEPADVERTLDVLIEQKKNLYANLGVANIFERPGYRDFFLELARDPDRRSLVHVSSVSVGPNIVAASFGLTFHGNYDYVIAGYQTGELEACSPGTVHLQELMQHFIERGFKTFDFNIGDEPYKHEWCDFELKFYDYLSPATFAGWGAGIFMTMTRILKRFIKRNPSIWPAIRKARSLIGTLRR